MKCVSVGQSLSGSSGLCLSGLMVSFKSSSWCSHQSCSFFPTGMFLTLTSRVCRALQGIKARGAKSLSSQVSKKITMLYGSLCSLMGPQTQPPELSDQLSRHRPGDLSLASGYQHHGAAAARDCPRSAATFKCHLKACRSTNCGALRDLSRH